MSSTSPASSCTDHHTNCKASHATAKHSERPPWDDSTKLSFAPENFQFVAPINKLQQGELPSQKRRRCATMDDQGLLSLQDGCQNVAGLLPPSMKNATALDVYLTAPGQCHRFWLLFHSILDATVTRADA
ncbi:hypothetical protein MRX96_010362 [Rhipicephalus microplus]